jgi:hypothetical protein
MFFNFVEVDNELLLPSVTTALHHFFFLESLSCAALCVQADVSALGKTNGFLGVCLFCAALCVQVDVSALGKINGFLVVCAVPHCAFKQM